MTKKDKIENAYLRLALIYINGLCKNYHHPDLGEQIEDILREMLLYVDIINKEL